MSDLNGAWDQFMADEFEKSAKKALQALKTVINANSSLRKENKYLRSENYKDSELQKMQEVLDNYKALHKGGFWISEDQQNRLNEWHRRHNIEAHGSEHPYFGASGGELTYCFTPTEIGAFLKARCTCGAEIDLDDI